MLIEAKEISLRYPEGTLALDRISLMVQPGEFIYITGPSGSGKTSLLKLLMGVEYTTEGALTVMGQSMNKHNTAAIRRLRMSMGPVFQEFRLIKGRSAMENVMLGMRFLDISSNSLKEYAREAIAKVGLEHKAAALVDNLSWGECQRIAIARAVARKPALILADEPTGNLDKDNALNILKLLHSFADKDTAVLITTHATHLLESESYSRHIHMNKGSIAWERLGDA